MHLVTTAYCFHSGLVKLIPLFTVILSIATTGSIGKLFCFLHPIEVFGIFAVFEWWLKYTSEQAQLFRG
jgi:hypothetical protein